MAVNLGTITKTQADWVTVHIKFDVRGAARGVYGELGITGKTVSNTVDIPTTTEWISKDLQITLPCNDVAGGTYAVFVAVWTSKAEHDAGAAPLWNNADANGRQQAIGTLVVVGNEFRNWGANL